MNFHKIFWCLPFLSFFIGYQLLNFLFNVNQIQVPNLIGKNIHEASKILSNKNLNLRILLEKENPNLQEGTIIDQTPINKKIRPNQSIYITLSKKPEKFKLPNFQGKNLEEIEEILDKKGIKRKIYYLSSNLPQNTCITHFPFQNETIENNNSVILYISSDTKKSIIFPDLKNLDLKEVLAFFKLYEISPKIYTKDSFAYNPEKNYQIIDQKPLSGTILTLNSNMNVQLLIEEN